ncbi:hypothetical protein [Corynebacterium casei]|uniref:hypothetical protein n=1 Tax=Corynebacterium casei TaxID=160386 RepID=UPI003BB4A8BD
MATRFPLGRAVLAIAMSEPRTLYEWAEKDGRRVRTDSRVTDSTGAPLSSVEFWCVSEVSDPMLAQATVPDSLLSGLDNGAMITLQGRIIGEVFTRRDSFDVEVRLEGIDRIASIEKWATAADLAAEVLADAT